MTRRVPPVWLMGATNTSFGLYGGFLVFTLPQALAAQHVPETKIAAITAVTLSPGFFIFLLSPMLDVRFSRRWYTIVFTVLSAAMLGLSVIGLRDLILLEIAATAGFAAIVLAAFALVAGYRPSLPRRTRINSARALPSRTSAAAASCPFLAES